jgi:hypothetical protein
MGGPWACASAFTPADRGERDKKRGKNYKTKNKKTKKKVEEGTGRCKPGHGRFTCTSWIPRLQMHKKGQKHV